MMKYIRKGWEWTIRKGNQIDKKVDCKIESKLIQPTLLFYYTLLTVLKFISMRFIGAWILKRYQCFFFHFIFSTLVSHTATMALFTYFRQAFVFNVVEQQQQQNKNGTDNIWWCCTKSCQVEDHHLNSKKCLSHVFIGRSSVISIFFFSSPFFYGKFVLDAHCCLAGDIYKQALFWFEFDFIDKYGN